MDRLFADKLEIEAKYSHKMDELKRIKDLGLPWYIFESELDEFIEGMYADIKDFVDKYGTI